MPWEGLSSIPANAGAKEPCYSWVVQEEKCLPSPVLPTKASTTSDSSLPTNVSPFGQHMDRFNSELVAMGSKVYIDIQGPLETPLNVIVV